jgi:glucokinase
LVRDAKVVAAADPERAARLLELAEGDVEAITGPSVTKAATGGDPLSIDLLAEVGRWVGEGAAAVAALLDPALIVIGGGVASAGDLILQPVRAAFVDQLSGRGYRPEARIELAAMGNDAGIVGAADLARL